MAASRSEESERRNYTRIFSRDASICALGMVASGEPDLGEGAEAGLVALARNQARSGQMPNFVDASSEETDFWYLGCIDATLWWLLAVDFAHRRRPGSALRERLALPVERAIRWLSCQEHPKLLLLQQNEASDWADIMPRSGFVLYTNSLWYRVKRLYGLPGAPDTRTAFNRLFAPGENGLPDDRRLRVLTHYIRNEGNPGDLYLSYVNFSRWGTEGDVFGNLLALLFGLPEEGKAARILRYLDREQVDAPHPVRVVCEPIRPGTQEWRPYMGRHRQNGVYTYHNGGIWPFVGGFWAIALAQAGRREKAVETLARLAALNRRGGWAFREWFHGRTGEPGGMSGQSWNAAMLLLARAFLADRRLLDLPNGRA